MASDVDVCELSDNKFYTILYWVLNADQFVSHYRKNPATRRQKGSHSNDRKAESVYSVSYETFSFKILCYKTRYYQRISATTWTNTIWNKLYEYDRMDLMTDRDTSPIGLCNVYIIIIATHEFMQFYKLI